MKTSKKTISAKSAAPKGEILPTELFQLEQSVGEFMQYWGFKRIHGRIWTHLYLSAKPLDTEELMQRLRVSKGLMSLAMRDLLHYNVIHQSTVGKHGTVFYSANDDLQTVIFNVLKDREAKMLETSRTALERLAKIKDSELEKNQIDRKRINSALNMTASASELLSFFLQQPKCGGDEIFSGVTIPK